ncbi:MAG: hypothetical protein ACHQXG_02705 [Nitrososphaerales archaeon]
MDKFHQELFDVLIRCRNVRVSKAASLATSVKGINKAQVIHDFINGKHTN